MQFRRSMGDHRATQWRQIALIAWLIVGASTPVAQAEEKTGSLVIIGGSERFDFAEFWTEVVRLAGGPGSKIAVFPTASRDPLRKGGWVVEALNDAGGDAFIVPLAWRKVSLTPLECAEDPDLVEQVRNCQGVFLIGGDQQLIVKALAYEDGSKTPMLEAIWEVYRRGGVIAGTSAGAAVMSRVMYSEADTVLSTLLNGVEMGRELDKGLGFLDEDWFVEQHCLVRGRFARALVAMHHQGIRFGLGVDENTAVIVTGGRKARVIGYKGALVMDLSKTKADSQSNKFNLSNIRLTYLDRGDQFDLKTMQVTPAQEKLEDVFLDPTSPDFDPSWRKPLFFNDILGNTTVADLMSRLMENFHPVAIGLAFDGAEAREKTVDGFEFRFTRDQDSVGWYTEIFGGDDYTVLNIRLDVRPVRILGPLYE